MTKRDLISIILARVNGGSFGSDIFKKIHPKIIEQYINLGINNAMFQIFKDTNNYDTYCKWYLDNEVSYFGMGVYICPYPMSLQQNVSKSNSVVKIVPSEDYDSVTFLPVNFSEAAASKRSGVMGRNGIIGFTTASEFIHFFNHNKDIEKVNILAFKPLEEYGLDESIMLPSGAEDIILTFVLKYAITDTSNKLVTDSNPDN